MIKKYITKTVVIEAIKWTGLNLKEVKEFVGESLIYDINDIAWKVGEAPVSVNLQIKTLEGVMWCMLDFRLQILLLPLSSILSTL